MKRLMMCLGMCLLSLPAQAEFILSNAIVEFSPTGETQQDVDLISRSNDQDYIVTELYEVLAPGTPEEKRVLIEDPAEAGLLVTPEKTILPGGGRQVLRLVLLRSPQEAERIYRVVVKPVITDIKSSSKMGLKVLVGYEMLVIVRPLKLVNSYTLTRNGRQLNITNNGNSNLLLEVGKQCPRNTNEESACKPTPSVRVYAGRNATAELPFDAPVTYRVWDGAETHNHDLP